MRISRGIARRSGRREGQFLAKTPHSLLNYQQVFAPASEQRFHNSAIALSANYRTLGKSKGCLLPEKFPWGVAMEPTTALIIAAAANGFGEGFGQGLAQALFGGSSGRKTRKALAEISRQLKEALQRLDKLIALVEELPVVLSVIVDKNAILHAKVRLQSVLEYINLHGEDEILPDATPQEFYDVYSSWRIVVILETNPIELVSLPYWTEIVRTRLDVRADKYLKYYLEQKLTEVDAEKDKVAEVIGGKFNEASAIIKGQVSPFPDNFTGGSVMPDEPFITWTAAPDRPEWEWENDSDRGGPVLDRARPPSASESALRRKVKIKENIVWNRFKQERIAYLTKLQEDIRSMVAVLNAAVSVSITLSGYIPTLGDGDAVPLGTSAEKLTDSDFQIIR